MIRRRTLLLAGAVCAPPGRLALAMPSVGTALPPTLRWIGPNVADLVGAEARLQEIGRTLRQISGLTVSSGKPCAACSRCALKPS